MFCQYCGREIDAKADSAHCGKNLQPAAKAAPLGTFLLCRRVNPRRKENRFNWAALFSGPYHHWDHGSTALFGRVSCPVCLRRLCELCPICHFILRTGGVCVHRLGKCSAERVVEVYFVEAICTCALQHISGSLSTTN